ncbi:MAG: TrkH family potassium uptake protein [Firmicutes bacterium]|nr:TrkH family potassium uptake protein [Bacillota bacterium]
MTFNHKFILRTLSAVLGIEGIAMILSLGTAVYDGDKEASIGFAISTGILLILAIVARSVSSGFSIKMKARESYFVVLVCWIAMIVGGTLPYLLIGRGYGVIDSIFESVASWTTSSAWVIDVNTMPRALVLWKATSNWLGGMGVIILTILVFSALGVNAQRLAGAELRGAEIEKHTARMADTVKILYLLYIGVSAVELVLLLAGGVPKFEALVNTMSTMSTAGLIDYHSAIAKHFTPFVKVVLVIFSVMASLNFVFYLKIAKRKIGEAFKDIELRVFLGIIAGATIFSTVVLLIYGRYTSLFEAIVNSITGVVSFACTTGFPLEHVETWPSVLRLLMVILMLIGGCAYSTSGGIKVVRFTVFVKMIGRGIYKRIHPRAVKPIMLGDAPVSALNASSISTYILLFLGLYVVSAMVLALENLDMETTLSAPVALLTNCGVGFGKVSNASYGVFSALGKLYCAFLMLMGRLEMYALLILFSRSFWLPDRTR